MITVAFVFRMLAVSFMYREHINPILDHWKFGWEMGEVARSIYLGHGFASPLFQPSGPTAWMTPVYPYLVALCFKLFGLHTVTATWAVLTLNSIFAACTAALVYYTARRTSGEQVASWAGWIWVVFPYSIYLSAGRIWENTLTAFLMSAIFLQTLRVEERPTMPRWLAWGTLWGAGALTSPALLATLPFLGLWIAYRKQRQGQRWFWGATVSAIVFFAMLSPWVVRNYIVFGKFIPLRDNFWLEVHVGNNGDTSDVTPDSSHPSNSPIEREQWNRLGEIEYMNAKKVQAKAFIAENPGLFAWVSFRRFVYVWSGFWSLAPDFLEDEPFHIPNVMFTTSMTLLFLLGLRFGYRGGIGASLTPYVLILVTFPVVYYFTHPSMDYRHPLDPAIVMLGCYGVNQWMKSRRKSREFAEESTLASVGD